MSDDLFNLPESINEPPVEKELFNSQDTIRRSFEKEDQVLYTHEKQTLPDPGLTVDLTGNSTMESIEDFLKETRNNE